MDWSNERYVRVYTRDTTTWKLLDWRARTVLLHLFRKVDRAGVLEVGDDGELGLAAVLELPIDIVSAGIEQLARARTKDHPTVVATGTAFVLPHFMDAQEATQSDSHRKRESRARRRDVALVPSQPVTSGHESQNVTDPGRNVTGHNPSQPVTSGHEWSQNVTDCPENGRIRSDSTENVRSGHERSQVVTPSLTITTAHLSGSDQDLRERREPPDLGAGGRIERDQGRTPPPGIPVPGGRDPRVSLNHDAWRYAAMEHARLREEGISPGAVLWPPMPAGIAQSDLVARTREVLAQTDPPDFVAARELITRRIDVAAAEAKREGHLNWFTPTKIWDERGFWRATEVTPEQAGQPRAPPRAPPGPRGTPDPERRRLKRAIT